LTGARRIQVINIADARTIAKHRPKRREIDVVFFLVVYSSGISTSFRK